MSQMKLKYSAGQTINIGNFESRRVDVGVELMTEAEEENIESIYNKMKSFVDEKVKQEVLEWQV